MVWRPGKWRILDRSPEGLAIVDRTPKGRKLRKFEVAEVARVEGLDAEAHAALIVVAPKMLRLLEKAHTILREVPLTIQGSLSQDIELLFIDAKVEMKKHYGMFVARIPAGRLPKEG